MKYIAIATLLAAPVLAVPAAALAAPPATHWTTKPMTLGLDTCINRARQSFVRAGATGIDVSDRSVRGYKGNTVGVMICIPGKDLLFIYTAGPSGTLLFRNALAGGF